MLDQEQKQQERLCGAHIELSLYAKHIFFNSLNGCETMSVQLCTDVYFCLNHTGDSEFNEKGKAANTGYLPYDKTKNVSNVYKSFPSADPPLQQFYWLLISEWITYKTACMCYNSVTGSAHSDPFGLLHRTAFPAVSVKIVKFVTTD